MSLTETKYNGIDDLFISIGSTGLTADQDEGLPVMMNDSDEVALPSAEDPIAGVLGQDIGSDGIVGLQVEGFVTLDYSGTAPTVGATELVCDGSGGVKTPTTAGTGLKKYLVVNVDTTNTEVTFKL